MIRNFYDLDTWKKEIKAIGFDVDGTLYQAPEALEEFFREKLRQDIFEKLAEKLGISLTEVEEIYFKKKKLLGSNTATMESFGFDGEKFFQELFDRFPLEEHMGRDERLIEMMTGLKSGGYRLFIISNGTGRQVRKKLKVLGIEEDWFESFICAYDYGWVKPQKEPFEQAMREMEIDRPEICFYVGDRCETDGVGAKSVGMRVGMITQKKCPEADVILKSVYEVGEVFGI